MGYELPGADSSVKGSSCLGNQTLLAIQWQRKNKCVCKQLYKQQMRYLQRVDTISLICKEIL